MRRLILILFVALFGFAQTAEDIAAQAEAKLRSLRSLQADFEHIYYSATVSTPLREKGRLYIQKPDWMKWEYRDPEEKTYLLKGGMFQSYFPEEKQLVIQSLADREYESEPLSLLLGQRTLLDNYEVAFSPFPSDSPKAWQIKLTPKTEDSDSYLLLEIDQKTRLISTLISFDWAGNKQEFRFRRIKTNVSFSASTFALRVPEDVEVIEDIKR